MSLVTELFLFKVQEDQRNETLRVLKQLQEEIILEANGSVRTVKTFIDSSDPEIISQVYEWSDLEEAKRVNSQFLSFKNASKLQVLNKENLFMGQLHEVKENSFSKS